MSEIERDDLTLNTFDPNWAIERNSHLHQGNWNLVYKTLHKLGKIEHNIYIYIYTQLTNNKKVKKYNQKTGTNQD